jgi:hypothetical protein
MLIYSHSTPDKLAPISFSIEYILDNTDLCGLVDDPDIGIDVEIAKQYNAALTGDPTAITTFITNILLSGYALDGSTLDWYVTRVKNNPVLFPYIQPIVNNSINFDYRDCLNSPCNYFQPTSHNIGSQADIANSLNYNTIPPIGLSAIPSAFSLGIASLNKIPVSIRESFGQITALTTKIFSNALSVFRSDPEIEQLQRDAIESGSNYRSQSIADIYTSDYRSYFDVSTAASDLLANVASTMGNCFRLYQYQHRYNPFDYRMNQQVANKSGSLRRINENWTSLGYNGVNLNHQTGYSSLGTDTTTAPTPGIATISSGSGSGRDEQIRGSLTGTTIKMYVTVFGGYYDEASKTLYRDASDKYNSPKGYEYFQNTQNGVGHRGGSYIYTPSLERTLINKWRDGFRYPSDSSTPQTNKFNRGFATDKQSIYNYFDLVSKKVTKSQISTAIAKGTLQARITFAGGTFVLPVIDTKGPSQQTSGGRSYRVIDLTADTLVDLYGLSLSQKSTKTGTIDTGIVESIVNYISYTGAGSPIATVQFLIPGVYNGSEPAVNDTPAPTSGNPFAPPLPEKEGPNNVIDNPLLPPRNN